MAHTVDSQIYNHFKKHGYDFDIYMQVIDDLNIMADAANECVTFNQIYDDCIMHIRNLERIVKEKFTADGDRIKND
jgi:hypothetical protein